jgi:hypothetical protein
LTKQALTRSFLHVPKSAGTSVTAALEACLPAGSVSPKRQDAELLCGFTDLDRIAAAARQILVVNPEEIAALRHYPVVSGHFSLTTLSQASPPERIATVLREPRARLLSHYAYWRLSSGLREMWQGYPPMREALRPLDAFLAEPGIAQATDNLVCRMLLPGDPRLPVQDFIADHDVAAVAADAVAVLNTFGYVGVVEQEAEMWEGLSRFFAVRLGARHDNTTAGESRGSDVPAIDLGVNVQTLRLIRARTAADRSVYEHVLGRQSLPSPVAEIGRAAFAAQLLTTGDTAGPSAQLSREQARTIDVLGGQLDRSERRSQELSERLARAERERDEAVMTRERWRQSLTTSISWRLTAPGRAVMMRTRRAFGPAAGRLRFRLERHGSENPGRDTGASSPLEGDRGAPSPTDASRAP